MKYAIELYYDEDTENQLFQLSKEIADKKISTKFLEWKTKPHLTLACFNDVEEILCIEKLKIFAENHKVMPAHLGSVGMFTDTQTIFVSPVMNNSMYQFQRELYTSLKDFDANGYEWYRPDRWVPHCTIALIEKDNREAFFQASDCVLRKFKKISGKFVSIGLTKITFPVEEIYTVRLAL